MDFGGFLNWLSSPDGGAFILVSWAVAWGLEGTAWWDAIKPKVKGLAILGVAVVIALAGQWVADQPDLLVTLDPYFKTVSAVIAVWLTTQTAHALDYKRSMNVG